MTINPKKKKKKISTRSGRVLSYDGAQIGTSETTGPEVLNLKEETELPRGIRDLVEEAEYFIDEDSGKEQNKTSTQKKEFSGDALSSTGIPEYEQSKPQLDFKGSYLVKREENTGEHTEVQHADVDNGQDTTKPDREEEADISSIATRLRSNRLPRGRASKAAMAMRASHLKQNSFATSEDTADTERRNRISFKTMVRGRRRRIRKRRAKTRGENIRRKRSW